MQKKTLLEKGEVTAEGEQMVLWGGIKNSKGKQLSRFVVASLQEDLLSSVYHFDTWLKYWQMLASLEL